MRKVVSGQAEDLSGHPVPADGVPLVIEDVEEAGHAGEDAKLAETLNTPVGDAGRMLRMHLNGAMYLSWLQLMEDKADSLAAATATISRGDDSSLGTDNDDAATEVAANAARSKAQFAVMKAQAERVDSIDAEMHVDDDGMVITSQTVLK